MSRGGEGYCKGKRQERSPGEFARRRRGGPKQQRQREDAGHDQRDPDPEPSIYDGLHHAAAYSVSAFLSVRFSLRDVCTANTAPPAASPADA